MKRRARLTVSERETIYREKLNGQSLSALAQAHHCSYSCARKWWRVGRAAGLGGLQRHGRARATRAPLQTFDPWVAERALYWKRLHPKRGATRILQDLHADDTIGGRALPHRSRLAAFFKTDCPELVRPRRPPPARPPDARWVHECWQLDSKENIRLGDGTIATVLDVREPVACCFLGSQAHAVQTAKAWRKLTLRETQSDLRLVFTAFGLPAGIQSDREPLYGQPPAEDFPSLFTLWLVGLGIAHHFSRAHRPTDQPQVERGHRTLCEWIAQATPLAHLTQLQHELDQAQRMHSRVLPSWAGDCHGRPPREVHPEVEQVQRPYHPAAELQLFQLERVEQFLAQFVWTHKVSVSGQVSVQSHPYYIGNAYAGHRVDVRFVPAERQLVFTDADSAQELKRRPIVGLDVATITGLVIPPAPSTQPIQLSFAL